MQPAVHRGLLPRMHNERRPTVLLVEDYDDAREMYRDYLEYSGFIVETAKDGAEALAKAQSVAPDIVLMDLSLPGIDGWEATRRLKADPATAHLTIVALSAHALAAEGDRAREAGCDGFIPKPCLPSDLVTQLVTYLKLDEARQRSNRSGSASRDRRTRPRRR